MTTACTIVAKYSSTYDMEHLAVRWKKGKWMHAVNFQKVSSTLVFMPKGLKIFKNKSAYNLQNLS